ncbi:membrane transporter [Mycobacterium xenopi RIVM700367]|uniref:MmpS family transport accessory protein n=1 Tax=Mycobacterium xenopi TaxID=1789 RepID=UPI00025ADA42|nr:MmpS family transport accessory protein [Mycobacterium xenopi]EID10538.1 membrane transporter [Mycobacterium xenopi RIVM700367]
MFTFLKRAWIPLIVVVAVTIGGIAVVRLRGVFGSDEVFRWRGSGSGVIESINIKHVTYEVFGPIDTAGIVSYLNERAQPEEANFTSLPWTYTVTTTTPAVIANVVVQGNSDSIGCRITVDGEVKDEQSSTDHHAQAFCLVKAA